MDYNKIGTFIAAERKAKKLTQAKLAEKIFVSEKTISKWENGNGIPDTNTLPKLCEVFGVTMNELLNGERISSEEYANKAESELLKLQKEKEQSDKRLLVAEIVIGSITTLAFLFMFEIALFAIYELGYLVMPIVTIVLGVILFLTGISFCLYIEQKAGFYVCKKCGYKHVPSFKQVLFAMHMGRTRYMKCPHCQQKSWQNKVIK